LPAVEVWVSSEVVPWEFQVGTKCSLHVLIHLKVLILFLNGPGKEYVLWDHDSPWKMMPVALQRQVLELKKRKDFPGPALLEIWEGLFAWKNPPFRLEIDAVAVEIYTLLFCKWICHP
jgi:hypothetical protein